MIRKIVKIVFLFIFFVFPLSVFALSVDAGPDKVESYPIAANPGIVLDGKVSGGENWTASWSQIGGPMKATIVGNGLKVKVKFIHLGEYVFRLTAKEGNITESDDVKVVIKKGEKNLFPIGFPKARPHSGRAPAKIVFHCSDDKEEWDGSGRCWDPDGRVVRAEWIFGDGATALGFDAVHTYSKPGEYTATIKLTDDNGSVSWAAVDSPGSKIKVVPPEANLPAKVDVGPDQTITLPNTAILNASVSDDGLPDPPSHLTLTWRAGLPGWTPNSNVSFDDTHSLSTIARFKQPGEYTLSLTAFDGEYESYDYLIAHVNPGNFSKSEPPTAKFRYLLLGPLQVFFINESYDSNGSIVSYEWDLGDGTKSSSRDVSHRYKKPGIYTITLKVTDDEKLTDKISSIVDLSAGGGNGRPIVNAGPDQTIILPNRATLNGSVTDDGLPNPPGILKITWSKVSGPGPVIFSNPNGVFTAVSFSMAGNYNLRLTAFDGDLSGSDDILVKVEDGESSNKAPIVDAGSDQIITLSSSVFLNGMASDDGLPNPPGIMTFLWSKVSGPGEVIFTKTNTKDTSATFSKDGIYLLRFVADDSEFSSSDIVQVTVNPPPMPIKIIISSEFRASKKLPQDFSQVKVIIMEQGGNIIFRKNYSSNELGEIIIPASDVSAIKNNQSTKYTIRTKIIGHKDVVLKNRTDLFNPDGIKFAQALIGDYNGDGKINRYDTNLLITFYKTGQLGVPKEVFGGRVSLNWLIRTIFRDRTNVEDDIKD